jgi:phosphate-selective porin OprO/OprP
MKMKIRWTAIIAGAAFLSAGFGIPGSVRAEEAGALQERIDKLEQRYNILERKYENDQEAVAPKAKDAPSFTAGGQDGFTLKSADKNFLLKLTGFVQADGRFYLNDTAGIFADQFLVRRVRTSVEGTLYKAVEFRIVPDFGAGTTAVQDAYVNLKYGTPLQFRAGRYKVPFGLERLQPSNQTLFIETSHATSLTPNYDIGLQLHGDLWSGVVNYALGAFNGVADGASSDGDNADGKDLAARIFLQPFKPGGSLAWKDLGIGFAVTRGRILGTSTTTVTGFPPYRTPGQQALFSYAATNAVAYGDRVRWSPQLYWYPGRVGVLGEYVVSQLDVKRISAPLTSATLTNRAWSAQASYALTGEAVTYNKGVKPLKPFDPAAHTWGAWELAGRYSELQIDGATFETAAGAANGLYANRTTAPQRARTWTGGINWYLNNAVKIQTEYDYTWFTGGAAGTGRKPAARELLTRFQVTY